jgi:hypothetical protein
MQELKDVTCGALPMFEFEWQQYLQDQKVALGGDAHNHVVSEPMVFYNKTEYVGSLEELKTFANATYQIKDKQSSDDFTVPPPHTTTTTITTTTGLSRPLFFSLRCGLTHLFRHTLYLHLP